MVNLQLPEQPVDRWTLVYYEVGDVTWNVRQRRMTYYADAAYAEHDSSEPRAATYARIVDQWMNDDGRLSGWEGASRFFLLNRNSMFTTEGEAFLNVRERIDKGIAAARQKIAELSAIGNAADERLYLLGLKKGR